MLHATVDLTNGASLKTIVAQVQAQTTQIVVLIDNRELFLADRPFQRINSELEANLVFDKVDQEWYHFHDGNHQYLIYGRPAAFRWYPRAEPVHQLIRPVPEEWSVVTLIHGNVEYRVQRPNKPLTIYSFF